MSFVYSGPEPDGWFRQGEILEGVVEHRAVEPPVSLSQGDRIDYVSFPIPHSVVMNAECDLFFDFEVRFPDGHIQQIEDLVNPVEEHHKALPHIILCPAYAEEHIIDRFDGGAGAMIRIKRHQDERYEFLPAASVGEAGSESLGDLYLDFKKAMALPTGRLYEGARIGGLRRVAVIPPLYLEHLVQRFFHFHERVGLP